MKDKAIIIDIDGTLADITHRERHVQEKPKNWPAFFKAMVDDQPYDWIIDLLNRFEGVKILITGRPEEYRSQTEAWLAKYKMSYDHLYMRSTGDYRQDTIVKKEIYKRDIQARFEVLFAIDDKDSIIEMWRELKLPCLQVKP